MRIIHATSNLLNLLNAQIRRAAEGISGPPAGVVSGSRMLPAGSYDVDLCIVTNCMFVGGNASSTVTELAAFRAAGLSVLIVHCPVKRTRRKRLWIAERYVPHQNSIAPADLVDKIRCRTVIARGPRMVMRKAFLRLARRIETERALFVVNNSAWEEDGRKLFDWPALNARVREIGWPDSHIYPLSEPIRQECEAALAGSPVDNMLAPQDWPPAFDVSRFLFAPRPHLTPPIRVGRHGRDHPGKWIEEPDELRSAYPDSPDITVNIMGGAASVEESLGYLPGNWKVEPFSTVGIERYLSELDVFVYFPSRTRKEAFGRTIVEALLSGLPTILPPRFEQTFGDLGIYCEAAEVGNMVRRLAADDDGRLSFVHACRNEAAARFGTENLIRRLELLGEPEELRPQLSYKANRFRRWVMTGI